MKRIGIVILVMLLLTGCNAAQTFESITDVYSPQTPEQRQVRLTLPEDAAAQVLSGDSGTLYLCDGYEVIRQVLPSGDLGATLLELTGYEKDRLSIIETGLTDAARYECVWTAAGEAGDIVARAAVLDDGSYHYCLTVMASAKDAGKLQGVWQEIFQSYGLD